MTKGFTYKSYVFVDKDPIIDEIRTVVQLSGRTYKQIHDDSNVSTQTLAMWFSGTTRRPQAATVNAVLRALGYKLGIVPYEVVPLIQPTPKSMGHVIRMAKIRRAK
jgi:hypothetical protein